MALAYASHKTKNRGVYIIAGDVAIVIGYIRTHRSSLPVARAHCRYANSPYHRYKTWAQLYRPLLCYRWYLLSQRFGPVLAFVSKYYLVRGDALTQDTERMSRI